MKKWNDILNEQSSRVDEPIKPQVVAAAVSNELDDNAIISVDSGINTCWAARFLKLKNGMKFSGSGSLATYGMCSTHMLSQPRLHIQTDKVLHSSEMEDSQC